jgi:hypothetical protein
MGRRHDTLALSLSLSLSGRGAGSTVLWITDAHANIDRGAGGMILSLYLGGVKVGV